MRPAFRTCTKLIADGGRTGLHVQAEFTQKAYARATLGFAPADAAGVVLLHNPGVTPRECDETLSGDKRTWIAYDNPKQNAGAAVEGTTYHRVLPPAGHVVLVGTDRITPPQATSKP